MAKEELTVGQAAEQAKLSRQQIYNIVRARQVKSRRVGRNGIWIYLIDRASLLAYVGRPRP